MAQCAHLNSTADINTYVALANRDANGRSKINPELFYTKQLLDTIRYDANQYVYYRLADETPIQEKADKLQLRRWAPLQAHTVPLVEGIPPISDKGSVEEYTIPAYQYGRYMEFTDKVDFSQIDPIIAHYTKEYSLVAMETFDMLARECLFGIANKYYASAAANFEALTVNSQPNMTDLRLIVLSLKKQLVKPRSNGRYHVIASPEFFYDMISDATVQAYMTINQTTKTMYDNAMLVPMFDMEFYETLCVPTSSEFVKDNVINKRLYRKVDGEYAYTSLANDMSGETDGTYVKKVSTWVKDSRTGQDASYIPNQLVWDLDKYNTDQGTTENPWIEFKAQHILIVGKDALTRTGLAGEGQSKVYVKQKGSAGVLDPIDQRQSIGFKINSVGFGSCRTEAIVDYICVPTQVNLI